MVAEFARSRQVIDRLTTHISTFGPSSNQKPQKTLQIKKSKYLTMSTSSRFLCGKNVTHITVRGLLDIHCWVWHRLQPLQHVEQSQPWSIGDDCKGRKDKRTGESCGDKWYIGFKPLNFIVMVCNNMMKRWPVYASKGQCNPFRWKELRELCVQHKGRVDAEDARR